MVPYITPTNRADIDHCWFQVQNLLKYSLQPPHLRCRTQKGGTWMTCSRGNPFKNEEIKPDRRKAMEINEIGLI